MNSANHADRKFADILVTFIVPTRNSIRTIRSCLASIRAQRHPSVELVVIDKDSTDGTWECANSFADVVRRGGPERSAQRNQGARLGSGQLLVFIDSDMVLAPDIAARAAHAFSSNPRLGAATIPEHSFGDGFWARCRGLEKRLCLGDPAVEAARIFRTAAFEEVGGYDERLTGPEDYELPDRIGRACWESGRIDAPVWHDEGRVRLLNVYRKKRYYGRTLGRYLAGPARSRSRTLLRMGLISDPRVLLREPLEAGGLVLLKMVDLAGLATGLLDARLNRRRVSS